MKYVGYIPIYLSLSLSICTSYYSFPVSISHQFHWFLLAFSIDSSCWFCTIFFPASLTQNIIFPQTNHSQWSVTKREWKSLSPSSIHPFGISILSWTDSWHGNIHEVRTFGQKKTPTTGTNHWILWRTHFEEQQTELRREPFVFKTQFFGVYLVIRGAALSFLQFPRREREWQREKERVSAVTRV